MPNVKCVYIHFVGPYLHRRLLNRAFAVLSIGIVRLNGLVPFITIWRNPCSFSLRTDPGQFVLQRHQDKIILQDRRPRVWIGAERPIRLLRASWKDITSWNYCSKPSSNPCHVFPGELSWAFLLVVGCWSFVNSWAVRYLLWGHVLKYQSNGLVKTLQFNCPSECFTVKLYHQSRQPCPGRLRYSLPAPHALLVFNFHLLS